MESGSTPGVFGKSVGTSGLVNIKSNADLDAEALAQEQAKNPPEPPKHINELAGYIQKCYEDAEQYRATTINERLLDCQRRRRGVYDDTRLAKIKERGACELFFNITDTKASTLEAWVGDILRPIRDLYALEPTPLPDLPDDIKTQIRETLVRQFELAQEAGDVITAGDVRDAVDQMMEQAVKAEKEKAQQCADRMAQKIADQQAEGGWEQALFEAVQYLCTYPIAIIKGPIIHRTKRLKWQAGQPAVTDEEIPTWTAVDPQDFYPAPNVKNVQDSYICETSRILKADLSDLRDVPGYSREEIEAVLNEEPKAITRPNSTGEAERADLEDRDTSQNEGLPPDTVEAIEFWGKVQGNLLKEWGMEVEDENHFYAITALLIGDHVVRAITNPDPLEQIPYFVTSYRKRAGTIWGQALPEKMADCQDVVNACLRNAVDNLALSSGPMVAVDIDTLPPELDPTKLYPWKSWQYHGSKAAYGNPITFFQPDSNATELQTVSEYFESKADDRTLIPRYAHGNEDVGGAGQTMGGLNMLMQAAAKGVKGVVYNLDSDIICPAIQYQYRWNLFNLPDEEYRALKGDIRVVPRGAMGALLKEEQQKRQLELLQASNNPTDIQIIRPEKGRRALYEAIVKDLGLPVDDIVPTEQEMAAQIQEQQMLMAEQQAQMGVPESENASQETRAA